MTTANFGYAPSVPQLPMPHVPVRHLRMTARGRRVLLALVTLPLVAVALAVALNGGQATATSDSVALTYVSVEQGQSLWQLAEQVAPSADPRVVIDDILTLNALDSSEVVVGQRIAIPAKYVTD